MRPAVLMWSLVWCLFAQEGPALGQVIGEEAELERLERRAEEAIANGDPDGAAMDIGKAALMAAQLADREGDPKRVRILRGAETLFRGQEHAYRAVALFERAGGRPPASSGVCGSISLAAHRLGESRELLGLEGPSDVDAGNAGEAERLRSLAEDWTLTVEDLRAEFQCPAP